MKRFCGSSPSVEDCLNCPYEECINDYVRKQYKPNGDIVVRRRQQQAEFRNKRRENGFCPYCGKRKMSEGYRMCEVCRAYFRAKKTKALIRMVCCREACLMVSSVVQNAVDGLTENTNTNCVANAMSRQ